MDDGCECPFAHLDDTEEGAKACKRVAVTRKAETWLGTPYHHMGRVKGAGTDCLMMLAEVYEEAGVVPHIEVPFYSPDWHLHRDAERYLEGIMGYAREIPGPPQPGDVAVFRVGCCYAHGAIVVEWPRIIHAQGAVEVIYGDAAQPKLASHKPCFLDPLVNIFVEPK